MADLSNAESIGGIVVTISGDDGPLRAVSAKVRQEISDLSQKSLVITPRLNLTEFESQWGKFDAMFAKAAEQAKLAAASIRNSLKSVSMAMVSPPNAPVISASNPWTSAIKSGAYGNIQAVNPWTTATSIVPPRGPGNPWASAVASSSFAMNPADKDLDNNLRRAEVLKSQQRRQLEGMRELEKTGTGESAEAREAAATRLIAINEKILKGRSGEFRSIGKDAAKEFEKGVIEQAGGGGSGGKSLASRNLFSARGLGALAGNVTEIIAADLAIRTAAEGFNAFNVASNPNRILRDMQHIGSASLESTDSSAGQMAQVIASSRGQEKLLSSFESIPLLGSLVQLGAATVDAHGNIADTEKLATRNIETGQFLHKSNLEQRLAAATLKGDQVGAFDITQSEKIAGLKSIADTSGTEAEIKKERDKRISAIKFSLYSNPGDAPRIGREEILQDRPELKTALDKSAEAQKQFDTQIKLSADQHDQLQRVVDAATGSVVGEGNAAELRGKASGLLGGRGGGSILAATKLTQEASLKQFDTETQSQLATNPGKTKEITEARSKERIAQTTEDGRQIQEIIRADKSQQLSVTAQGDAAILQANQKSYAAKIVMLKDSQRKELDEVQAHSPDLVQATIDSQKKVLDAAGIEQGRLVSNSIATSVGSIGSSVLSAQGLGFQGAQFARRIQQRQALSAIENPYQRAFAAAGFGAENFLAQRQYDFESKSTDISLNASIAASKYLQKDEPLSARIAEAGAAADLAVRTGPADKIELRRTAELEKLKALHHELFDPHSGGYAAIGSAFFTPGDPLGLTKMAQDRQNAAKEFQNAQNAVQGEKGQTIDPGTLFGLIGDLIKAATGNFVGNGGSS